MERWEDPGYRSCWKSILDGDWRAHDPYDVTSRLDAKFDLYYGQGACSLFRAFQGWISTSDSKEGGLMTLPIDLRLQTAYCILRPFFKPKRGPNYLGFNDWELDLDSTKFPGSAPGRTLELSNNEFPHLQLDKTMVSVPHLKPGDQFYWHSDVVHAVEPVHTGNKESRTLFIPGMLQIF